jgi:hypothetical protein
MLKNILFIVITALLISCEGPTGPNGKDGLNGEDGGNDKEIRLYFNPSDFYSQSNSFMLLPEDFYIVKFNKSNYVGVDSIIFMATLGRGGGAEAKLFNVTDNIDIPNTLLQASGFKFEWRETSNIFTSFPNTEITVGIKLRAVPPGESGGQISSPMLILYR